MKIIVTGCAGFIGAATAEKLCQRGDEVLGLDNLSDYYDVNLKKARLDQLNKQDSFNFQKVDLKDKENFFKAYKSFKPDKIVHMAAQPGVRYSLENPDAYMDSNIIGFMNVLEACRHFGTEHLTFASSSSVYGANSKLPYAPKDSTNHPMSLYAATKKSNEMMAHSYSSLFKIPITGLRFFTVYGPWGRPDMAVYSFTNKIMNDETIDVFNEGRHQRDFTFIDDIVEGIVKVNDKAAQAHEKWDSNEPLPHLSYAPFRVYNIGNHQPVYLDKFIETLETVMGKTAKMNFKEIQPGDVVDTFADCSDLMNEFNYSPNTPIDEGLKKWYEWYKQYYKANPQ